MKSVTDKDKKKIVLVLPRGEAIRNFVYSGTATLLQKSAHVTIISIIPNNEIELLLKENCDDFYDLKEVSITYMVWFLWEWIDIVHGKWLWSGVAKWRWKIRDSEADSFSKKIKRALKKISTYPFINRPAIEFLTNLEGYLAGILLRDKYYTDLLNKIQPDLVFNGSHIHSLNSRPVIHAAKSLGIKTAAFLFSWDNLTSQGRILPNYDFYLVWNEQIKQDLLRIYKKIKPLDVFVTGTPQFDFHFEKNIFLSREQFADILGVDPSRPIILYTTGMQSLMPFEEIIVERLADICLKIDSKPQLVVRVYPKDQSGRFDALKESRNDVIFPKSQWVTNHLTPTLKDQEFYSNLLYHCNVGINVASTVSLELCIFDKPVINIGYNPPGVDISPRDYSVYYNWDHYKPLTDSGAIDIVLEESKLMNVIVNNLTSTGQKSLKRKKLIMDFFGPFLDGKSHIRIAEKLLELANK